MDCLKTFMLNDSDHLITLRHDVHNILDWGTLTHKRDVCEVLDEIHALTTEDDRLEKKLKDLHQQGRDKKRLRT